MKIYKTKFISILAKHLAKKLGGSLEQSSLNVFAQSLTPVVGMYEAKMREKDILDANDKLNIDNFSKAANDFFLTFPTINIPVAGAAVAITKVDTVLFIKELESKADIDEVIYLPCQN